MKVQNGRKIEGSVILAISLLWIFESEAKAKKQHKPYINNNLQPNNAKKRYHQPGGLLHGMTRDVVFRMQRGHNVFCQIDTEATPKALYHCRRRSDPYGTAYRSQQR